MRVALNNTPSYSRPNFKKGSPKEVTIAFHEVRKQFSQGLQKVAVDVNSEKTASILVEPGKNKNWILAFAAKFGEKKAEITHASGDKTAIESLLKDSNTKKALDNFLKTNGVELKRV